ncbi:hypothetical protein GCM10010329_28850 [Streptomyces spiroverticillatus]|uniref:Uncharacterized protein n=2 Tax=Streptomyces finlayi TaxID=67296 RepID=A0A918WVX2_9ACTN|nr:hypothetical protein GCM10010329_28850 [Streptomyces spiroverticillatus]GHC88506.1 hypothetical protein GCM10010334_21260 [Streptomyces finlayi]
MISRIDQAADQVAELESAKGRAERALSAVLASVTGSFVSTREDPEVCMFRLALDGIERDLDKARANLAALRLAAHRAS